MKLYNIDTETLNPSIVQLLRSFCEIHRAYLCAKISQHYRVCGENVFHIENPFFKYI